METLLENQTRTECSLGVFDSTTLPYDVVRYQIIDNPVVVQELQYQLEKPLDPDGLDFEIQEQQHVEGALRTLLLGGLPNFLSTVYALDREQRQSLDLFKRAMFAGEIDRRTKTVWAAHSAYEAVRAVGLVDSQNVERIEGISERSSSSEGENRSVDSIRLAKIKVEAILHALDSWHRNNRFL